MRVIAYERKDGSGSTFSADAVPPPSGVGGGCEGRAPGRRQVFGPRRMRRTSHVLAAATNPAGVYMARTNGRGAGFTLPVRRLSPSDPVPVRARRISAETGATV